MLYFESRTGGCVDLKLMEKSTWRKIMNKIVKVILVSGIYALGYWIYFFIMDAMVPVWYTVKFWGERMVILPITYAVFSVILLYKKSVLKRLFIF